jgi:pimeloyl-ACP methyl ester carboxylesterase
MQVRHGRDATLAFPFAAIHANTDRSSLEDWTMNATHETVVSADGTRIAYEAAGSGRPVILTGGAFNDRSTTAGLAAALAPHVTAVTSDRRGRGESDDASAADDRSARQHEFDDLAAVVGAVGGRASLFGHSSGGVLILEAAAARRDLGISKLVVYEPAYVIEGTRPVPGSDLAVRLRDQLDRGRLDDAVALYQTEAIGLPGHMVEGMRGTEVWGWLMRLAPSLPYDAALYDPGFAPPVDRLARIDAPTLAIAGSKTFGSLIAATRAVADAVPGARFVELEGEDHGILQRPDALVSVMVEFLS